MAAFIIMIFAISNQNFVAYGELRIAAFATAIVAMSVRLSFAGMFLTNNVEKQKSTGNIKNNGNFSANLAIPFFSAAYFS